MSTPAFRNPFSSDYLSKASVELEEKANRLRTLIASQPPKELIGYIYSGLLMQAFGRDPEERESSEDTETDSAMRKSSLESAQFLLEYVHAVLATTPAQPDRGLEEATCTEIMAVADDLRTRSMMVAMAIAAGSSEDQFGPQTKDLIFRALSNWIMLRGNRYQVLEEEFFRFTLGHHDEALRRAYGAGAVNIAVGIQALSDSIRQGHMRAALIMFESMENAQQFLSSSGKPLDKDGVESWKAESPEQAEATLQAFSDLFHGGICCVSRHTALPVPLLDDLSVMPGEESDFFAPGPFAGTPFRALPVRKKPLIKLGDEHYLVDPTFARDAAYRAILFNLLQRDPGYKTEFEARQKEMSEAAFCDVFSEQLQGARVFNEVYYRHEGNWFENDTLVLIGDVLILVEAKSGAAATIASPASNFERHARDMRDLILKAYKQCRRFLEYLSSADELPLYRMRDGKYEEMLRIRLKDYRLVLPFGLTVETFSPFSTASNQLPGVDPILGRHAFISVSIDELLVLRRFLPTTDQLMHYLSIRQDVAGLSKAFLFDETDHLGAYIAKNRYNDDIREQLAKGVDMLAVHGMSDAIDEYFGDPDWESTLPPSQPMPDELQQLLDSLNNHRRGAWLEACSHLRDYGSEGRQEIANALGSIRQTLGTHSARHLVVQGIPAVMFWLQRSEGGSDESTMTRKAQAALLASDADRLMLVAADVNGAYTHASASWIERPRSPSVDLLAEADAFRTRSLRLQQKAQQAPTAQATRRKPGRNDPCWCGSSLKFKKCHGR